jgi:hypothetical protein
MSLEREVLPNWTDARQESLRAFRSPEAMHPTLARTQRMDGFFVLFARDGPVFARWRDGIIHLSSQRPVGGCKGACV